MPKKSKYTKEILEPIIKSCTSWPKVCGALGLVPLSGSQGHIKKIAIHLGIDFSHFKGQTHNRGKIFGPKRPISDYLSNNFFINSSQLRKRLIREGYKEAKCEKCGLTEWLGGPIDLELDHINGNHFDNSLSNLQILCPNCHAFETRVRRKKRRISGPNREIKRSKCLCGDLKIKKSPICKKCTNKKRRKFNPAKEELLSKVWEMPTTAVAKYYGVSDKAIEKRCNKFGISKPPRGYWAKRKYGKV